MANKKIGIIGAGRLGVALARLLQTAGYEVDIANSGDKTTLDLTLRVLLPGVHAKAINELVRDNEWIILALPFGRYKKLDASLFSAKVIIDATNYWEPTEGKIDELASSGLSSSEFLRQYFVDAHVIKTFNHIAYSELWEDSMLNVAAEARAVAFTADDVVLRQAAAKFIQNLGFEPVDFGSLANGKHFQPDTMLFNSRLSAAEMNYHKNKIMQS